MASSTIIKKKKLSWFLSRNYNELITPKMQEDTIKSYRFSSTFDFLSIYVNKMENDEANF